MLRLRIERINRARGEWWNGFFLGFSAAGYFAGDDGIHGSVIFHQLHGLVDHQIFQPLFPHGLFIAGLFLLGSSTLVVGIHFPGVADTAFSEHQCTALAAVQLGGEQIAFLCLM